MEFLKDEEEKDAEKWIRQTAQIAERSLCLRDKCGAVIVKDEICIGKGYNAPPLDNLLNRMCLNEYAFTNKKKSDRTCCMHAEWRAILDATSTNPNKLMGSRIYFMRLDATGAMTKAGNPYCTVCSRFALDVGITDFVLWHENGIAVYPTTEFNKKSYEYLME